VKGPPECIPCLAGPLHPRHNQGVQGKVPPKCLPSSARPMYPAKDQGVQGKGTS